MVEAGELLQLAGIQMLVEGVRRKTAEEVLQRMAEAEGSRMTEVVVEEQKVLLVEGEGEAHLMVVVEEQKVLLMEEAGEVYLTVVVEVEQMEEMRNPLTENRQLAPVGWT
jgi:hypothetical protein